MGAWGQPMSMSFSQAHHAVLYGSETNCAMIPIATRPGVAPVGGGEAGGIDPPGTGTVDVQLASLRPSPVAAGASAAATGPEGRTANSVSKNPAGAGAAGAAASANNDSVHRRVQVRFCGNRCCC